MPTNCRACRTVSYLFLASEGIEDIGLKKIDAKDKEFNPYLHEALLQEKSDKDNIVLEELQKGYKLNDKVLRPVKVKIGKKD